MAADFALGTGVVVHAPEMIAVGHRGERAIEGKNFEAMAGEIEFANDFGAEEGDYIGALGEKKTGDDFFGDGGAAENVAAFEDKNFFAGFSEIGSVDQSVVAAADDDCVVMLRHAVKLHTNPRMKDIAETGRARQFTGMGRLGTRGLGRKRKRSHCSEAHTHGADFICAVRGVLWTRCERGAQSHYP